MATRSRIAIENQDGSVDSVYCHWDGYPEHNGAILKEHYLDREKVVHLISLGSISVLAPNVEPSGPHSFTKPQPGTVIAYHRDRGESYQKPARNRDAKSYFKSDIEEYGYLFTTEGEWVYVRADYRSPEKL